VGYTEDKQKIIERSTTKIEVGNDFWKPFIDVIKLKRLMEYLDTNF